MIEIDYKIVLLGGQAEWSLSLETIYELSAVLLKSGYACSIIKDQREIELHKKQKNILVVSKTQESRKNYEGIDMIELVEKEIEPCLMSIKELLSYDSNKKPWKPWFPVIDYDKCTNCMQCLSFCLFDVYSVENEKIKVQNQNKCKTDCPACSRVCPEAAILFPKYSQAPINGAEVDEASLDNEKMKVDISALLGGDIYASLRNRSQHANTRFSKERSEAKALKERKKCLIELKEKLDIPDSVLSSLPNQAMIQNKLDQL